MYIEHVPKFCFKFDLIFVQFIVSIFLGCMINLALLFLVLIWAIPQTIPWLLPVFMLWEHWQIRENTRLVYEDVVE